MTQDRHAGETTFRGTTAQQSVIDRIPAFLDADDRILAGWLAGSYATSRADAYSDIDLHCLITDESADWFQRHWSQVATDLVGPLVLAQDIPGTIGGYSITPDWLHLDLILHRRIDLDPRTVTALYPLYDRTGDLLPKHPVATEAFGEPFFPDREIKQFLYFLGNIPVIAGRGELVLLHASIDGFRQIMITIMLAERGIRDRGGAKRLNPFLTAEQRSALESLPTAPMDRDQILHALRTTTRAIRQRGKHLAEILTAPWPHQLENAALRSIHRHIGIDFT
jgi:hypothetical protein